MAVRIKHTNDTSFALAIQIDPLLTQGFSLTRTKINFRIVLRTHLSVIEAVSFFHTFPYHKSIGKVAMCMKLSYERGTISSGMSPEILM